MEWHIKRHVNNPSDVRQALHYYLVDLASSFRLSCFKGLCEHATMCSLPNILVFGN